MNKYYIAYGSNLNLSQMSARCPTAVPYAKGILQNQELIYRGEPTNSYATIRKKEGSYIPILIWIIQDSDEKALDLYENYPALYHKESILAETSEAAIEGMVYIMNQNKKPGKPSPSYIETIRQGYQDNSFDLSPLEQSLAFNKLELNKNENK